MALVTILPEFLIEDMVKKLSDNFFQLSETAAGAVCILEILGSNPADLQRRIVETYTGIKEEDGQRLISHLTGLHSQLVFQACLCLLGPRSIRPLLSSLMSSITPETLSSLSRHKAMVSLVQHVARIDPPSLFVIANCLEKINCLFEEEFHDLVKCLICKGGVKVCGIFLHNVSGKISSVVRSPYGRQVMAMLIANFSDLQLHIGNWFYFMR